MAKKPKGEADDGSLLRFTEWQRTLRLAILAVVALGLAYFAYLSVKEMAGKSTSFRSVIDWGLKLGLPTGLALVLSVILTGGAVMALRSRRKMAAQAGPRLAFLEAEADAKRSSSGLDSGGTSPKGDRHD